MAKFYVQSGNVAYIVAAQDSQGAALWLLNQQLKPAFPFNDLSGDWEPTDLLELAEYDESLGEHVAVSQIGFGRDEAGLFETVDLVDVWQSLCFSMMFLFDQLD